jgi:hypothetical protein
MIRLVVQGAIQFVQSVLVIIDLATLLVDNVSRVHAVTRPVITKHTQVLLGLSAFGASVHDVTMGLAAHG